MYSQNEFKILLQCIRLDDPDDAAKKAEQIIRSGPIDWEDLFERAKMHCIRPQLAKLMNRITYGVVPGEFIRKINEYHRQNLSLQMRNVTEFFRVKEMLDREGIEAVPFKGFSLAYSFYESLADREGTDVDLFFSFRDFDRVTELMTRNGYKPEASLSPAFIRKIKSKSAEYNFERFEQDEMVFHVEFHWKMGSSVHGMEISLDQLAPHTTEATVYDHTFRIFGTSAALLLVIMHHGGKDALVQLKQVFDIGLIFTKNDIDWDWLMGCAAEYDIEKLVFLSARLSSELTGVNIPENIREASESPGIRRMAEERKRLMAASPAQWHKPSFNRRNFFFHLRSRTGAGLRLMMIAGSLRRSIVCAVFPARLMNLYLRKRYGIDRSR